MRSRRALVIGLAVVALGACGDDERDGSVEQSGGSTTTTGTTGTTSTPAPSGAAAAKVQVTETEYELEPKNPRIAKVGVVSFAVENAGKVTHSLEVEAPGAEVETEGIEPGGKATLKVDLSKPGTYEWYCPIGDHKDRGMKGRITVAGGGAANKHSDDAGKHIDDAGRGGDDSAKRGGESGKRSREVRKGRNDPDNSTDGSGRRGGAGGGVY